MTSWDYKIERMGGRYTLTILSKTDSGLELSFNLEKGRSFSTAEAADLAGRNYLRWVLGGAEQDPDYRALAPRPVQASLPL